MSVAALPGAGIRLAPPKLIIFDFDGTLAETEVVAAEVIAAKLFEHDVRVDTFEVSTLLAGVGRDKKPSILEETYGIKLNSDFMDEVRTEVRKVVWSAVAPTAGAIETLRQLTIPFCVASNTPRQDLIARMRAAKLFELIGPRFFSAEDVGVRKPDPSVLLLASEAMGAEPKDCLVIEDSTVGLEAAMRAKMRFCAFVGARHHSERMRTDLQSFTPEALLFSLTDLETLLAPT